PPQWLRPPLDAPKRLRWDDEALPCRRCKLPTHWRTPRGAKTHPNCDASPWDELTPEAWAALVFDVALQLGAVVSDEPIEPRDRNIHIVHGPCSWCRQPGIGITDDRYLHC